MDSQTIELLGRNRLVSELLRAGLEVAIPARDRGIDLIAYIDLIEVSPDLAGGPPQTQRFTARPIQMKAASQQSFSISKKYAKLRDLIIAFVWNLEDPPRAVTYALTHDEAVAVGDALGWTATPSWIERHAYGTTRPGARIVERLEPFRMTPPLWRAKILGAGLPEEGHRRTIGDGESVAGPAMSDGQCCPVCGTAVAPSSRYPRYVCSECVGRARSADGRPLAFDTANFSGGVVGIFSDTGEEYAGRDCVIDGVRCRAEEAYLGGVVVLALD